MMRSILGALNAPCPTTGVSASSNAPRGYGIAMACVDAEETALIVVEVEKVEADATISTEVIVSWRPHYAGAEVPALKCLFCCRGRCLG